MLASSLLVGSRTIFSTVMAKPADRTLRPTVPRATRVMVVVGDPFDGETRVGWAAAAAAAAPAGSADVGAAGAGSREPPAEIRTTTTMASMTAMFDTMTRGSKSGFLVGASTGSGRSRVVRGMVVRLL